MLPRGRLHQLSETGRNLIRRLQNRRHAHPPLRTAAPHIPLRRRHVQQRNPDRLLHQLQPVIRGHLQLDIGHGFRHRRRFLLHLRPLEHLQRQSGGRAERLRPLLLVQFDDESLGRLVLAHAVALVRREVELHLRQVQVHRKHVNVLPDVVVERGIHQGGHVVRDALGMKGGNGGAHLEQVGVVAYLAQLHEDVDDAEEVAAG